MTYCLNVHPGETWEENFEAIRTVALKIRKQVAPKRPFGLGLRLGRRAAEKLSHPQVLHRFKAFLVANDLYVFTINGFPYGEFHRPPVKKRVYWPDWRSPKRLAYTLLLGEILSGLLPEGIYGSISTVPGSYGEWIVTPDDRTQMIQNLMGCVAHLAQIHKKTGKEIHVGLEPEPDCFLETTKGTIDFFTRELLVKGRHFLAGLMGTSEQEAGELIIRHLGVCFDTCHMSLQYENLAESIALISANGIRLSKIQISAALKVPFVKKSLKRLEDFCDPVYLHQVKGSITGGDIRSWEDLPDALSGVDGLNQGFDQWRIHFHVPLYFKGDQEVGSTGSDLNERFFRAAIASGCGHFEIETYTFNVLPEQLRGKSLTESIADEYGWVLERTQNTEFGRQNHKVDAFFDPEPLTGIDTCGTEV